MHTMQPLPDGIPPMKRLPLLISLAASLVFAASHATAQNYV